MEFLFVHPLLLSFLVPQFCTRDHMALDGIIVPFLWSKFWKWRLNWSSPSTSVNILRFCCRVSSLFWQGCMRNTVRYQHFKMPCQKSSRTVLPKAQRRMMKGWKILILCRINKLENNEELEVHPNSYVMVVVNCEGYGCFVPFGLFDIRR